jgi:hypothetical protein
MRHLLSAALDAAAIFSFFEKGTAHELTNFKIFQNCCGWAIF